jgi:serine/threonine protein phosphatase PrpC
MRFVSDGLTDIGRVRKDNQDAFLIQEEEGFFAVADGIGGLQRGAMASEFLFGLHKPLSEKGISEESNEVMIKEVISELSDLLRREIGDYAGSTLMVALTRGESICIAHLGDSRAYILRGGRLERLTKDHNMASRLLDAGEITFDQAWHHPMRNVLTRYVGMEHALPEIKTIASKTGDRLLLCTDGLSSMLPDKEIARVLMGLDERSAALKQLIARANEASGEDNVTALMVDCVDK